MAPFSPGSSETQAILASTKTIAIVGLSDKPQRDSNIVLAFLLARGFDCVGINPALAGQSIHGAPVFASLADVDRPIDMVDVFRASEAVGGIVDEALALEPRPKIIWTQLGVFDETAGRKAEAAGLTVVMNRCPKIELAR
jgi:predicted CoA-binding protein